MKLAPQEILDKQQAIVDALDAAGLKIDELTVNALALLVIQICVRARVAKKQFMQIIRDNWRHEVLIREAKEVQKLSGGADEAEHGEDESQSSAAPESSSTDV